MKVGNLNSAENDHGCRHLIASWHYPIETGTCSVSVLPTRATGHMSPLSTGNVPCVGTSVLRGGAHGGACSRPQEQSHHHIPPPRKEEEMCLVWHIWNFIYLSWSAGDEAKALGMPGSTLCHCATPPAAVLMNLNLNDHLQLLATILDRTVLYFQVMFPGIRHHTQISWIIANSKFNFDLEFVPKVKVQGKRRNTLYTITNRVDKKEKCNWSPKQLKSIHHQQIILIFSFLL
jgi:hypothetical protein